MDNKLGLPSAIDPAGSLRSGTVDSPPGYLQRSANETHPCAKAVYLA